MGVRGELRYADFGAAFPGGDFGRIWVERTRVGYRCGWGAGALLARDFGDWGADAGRFGYESVVATGGGGARAPGSHRLLRAAGFDGPGCCDGAESGIGGACGG